MSSPNAYPRNHPVSVGLAAVAYAVCFRVSLMEALTERARYVGVATGSDCFDKAAEIAGIPYCRALDLYVDRPTKARAEALHFSEAHRALSA